MSVTSSRLRHQGLPGLQAQKCESAVNTRATAIVIGTTFAIVCPTTLITCIDKSDMTTSFKRRRQGYPVALKEP